MAKRTRNMAKWISAAALLTLFSALAVLPPAGGQETGRAGASQKRLDPATWGSHHVGQPVPDFVHGDECLFCHRNDIGPSWQKNAHSLTVRQREDAPDLEALLKAQPALSNTASEVQYFLGSRQRVRFLKKEGYGKFAILSTQAVLSADRQAARWADLEKPFWDREKFAQRCAGCHTTAVDAATKTFSAFGLDCYVCHGAVDLNHTKNTELILFSKKREKDSRIITSICAQCHLRGGKSRSTGLPYPNNFVAGDNLFQDFTVDWAKADDPSLNAGDRHVLRNVRDVVLYGSDSPTCITCHQVHGNSSAKHRRALRSPLCFDCHQSEGPFKVTKPYTVKSPLCEY